MTRPERVEDVVAKLDELGKSAVPVEDPVRAAYRRERVIRAIGRSIEQAGSASGRRLRWGWLAAAAGVFLLVAAGGVAAVHYQAGSEERLLADRGPGAAEVRFLVGGVEIQRPGASLVPATLGEVFQGGELVKTSANGELDLGIESGRARLGPSSELQIVQPTPAERRLRLGTGGIDVDLPVKLARGERLVIETPDADVVVVGTAFTVGVRREGGQSVTSVSVRRGTVWVRRAGRQEAVLSAGQAWRSPERTAAVAAAPLPAPASVQRSVEPKEAAESASARNARAVRALESGTLAEENRLFEAALAARNAGQHLAAAESFRTLLARYPRSVLGEQALAGQFASLERAGRTTAAALAARRYLASYPQGFARANAARVAEWSNR